MKKINLGANAALSIAVLATGIFASLLIVANAQTQNVSVPANITYPIAELGNCKNQGDCKSYCDKIENVDACVNFAEKNNMISAEDAAQAKKIAKIGKGPGGCANKKDCENYCEDTSNINECLTFAEKNDILPAEQLAEAKKVAKVLREGGSLPGGCKGKKDCDNYCSDSSHMEECFNFAEKAGMIPADELERAKKVMPLLLKGESPGGCKSKNECENYCSQDGRFEECINFAEKAGLMNKEELDMARKTGGKGPGGCKSKKTCDNYCNIPENQEACLAFAKDKGLIPAEKLQEMKDGIEKMKTSLSQAPAEVTDCLKQNFGEDAIAKMQNGEFTPGAKSGEIIKNCFMKIGEIMRQRGEKEGFGNSDLPPGIQQNIQEQIQQKFGDMKEPPTQEQINQFKEQFKEQTKNQMKEQIKGQMPADAQGANIEIPEQLKNTQGPPLQNQMEGQYRNQIQTQMQNQAPPSSGGPVPAPMNGVEPPQIPIYQAPI